MGSFQIATCSVVIDSVYYLLLSKKLVGDTIEFEEYNLGLSKFNENLGIASLTMVLVSIREGVEFTVTPVVVNYFMENLYPLFFENAYWRESVINFATHQGASYLLIAYTTYKYKYSLHEIIKDSIEIMIFTFIFQNYGAVATFINLTLSNLLFICRIRYLGW